MLESDKEMGFLGESPKPCPGWRRVAVVNKGRTLIVLCGKRTMKERLPALKDFGRRLRKCPLGFPPETPCEMPQILVFEEGWLYDSIDSEDLKGREGIDLLNTKWEAVKREFTD